MRKPADLRAALEASVQEIRKSPENLHVFVSGGNIQSTNRSSLSFQYSYTLELTVTDYAGDPDALMIPVLAWLRINQSDLLANADKDSFSFEVDVINAKVCDIAIKLKLTEAVVVSLQEKSGSPGDFLATVTHPPEVSLDEHGDVKSWELHIGDEVVSWSPALPFNATPAT